MVKEMTAFRGVWGLGLDLLSPWNGQPGPGGEFLRRTIRLDIYFQSRVIMLISS